MQNLSRIKLAVGAIAVVAASWALARAADDPPVAPSPAGAAKDAAKSRFARVDLRSIVEYAPFRDAPLERQREILDRYRPTIDLCRQEMDTISDEWEKLPEHDEIPPQLEDRTEEVLKRWEKARRGLIADSIEFAGGEGKPFRERLRTMLEEVARRGGFEAVFQLPREGGGATWGMTDTDDADFGESQAVVWCRDCADLTDELAEFVGIPDDAWVEGSAFRRAAIDFQREFESYAEPPPWEWDLAAGEGDEEAPE